MDKPGEFLGRVVNRYRFDELIGRGGLGEVYKAHDLHLLRDVAIKVSDPDLADRSGRLEQFLTEARAQARLEHINIVPIYDVFKDSRSLFIVMRLLQGENLDEKISRLRRPLAPSEAVGYFRQVLEGMDFAHSKGVIHQDLKPSNLLVTPSGEALVLDFSIARILEGKAETSARRAGSPAYMAPEQVSGGYTDARTDIYALGMTLYTVVTGRHPFAGAARVAQLLQWQVDRSPPPPAQLRSQISRKLSDAVMCAISKEPRHRFRSCRDFASALRTSVEDEEPQSVEADDDRWDPRARVSFNARIKFSGGDIAFSARTIDLSVGGVRLRGKATLSVGTEADLEIYVPEGKTHRLVRSRAVCVSSRRHPLEGDVETSMSYIGLSQDTRRYLSKLVRDILLSERDSIAQLDDTVLLKL